LRTNSPPPSVAASDRPASRGFALRSAHLVYGVYTLTLLAVLIVVAALLALLLPLLSWRRAVTRSLARFWLRASGLRVRVDGLTRLPAGSCVLVANHASYLDGVVMKAALPPRFSFVIKREAADMPVLGLLLRRIGSEFVDRHTSEGRQRDARRVVKRAEQGHSLVFFPEGTFDSRIGLKHFHIGAFVAATRGNVPVVPAVIRGARRSMPNNTYVPRPGRIVVEIREPIACNGRSAGQLRDESRRAILERLGEPDLAPVPTRARAPVSAPADA
jgi:1-acyl-sn-glycerol-3-phosphate acyltransferase